MTDALTNAAQFMDDMRIRFLRGDLWTPWHQETREAITHALAQQPPFWRQRVLVEVIQIIKEWQEALGFEMSHTWVERLAEAIADGLPSPTPENGFTHNTTKDNQ